MARTEALTMRDNDWITLQVEQAEAADRYRRREARRARLRRVLFRRVKGGRPPTTGITACV
jgi:hypothetical protein